MTQINTNPSRIELMPPSISLRVGRRRLTLTWRARLRLPTLLSGLLQRSWKRVLAPTLRVSIAAAAVCGAWQMPAMAAAPAPGTLPAGWSVVNGNVTFTQNGNTLNINQLSPQAIANFVSFSIGADATVNVNQPNSLAALLARVTGGDISQIYGKLTAPGTVVLYNPNGLVIGPGGMVDVGRFIGTTLNISDSDFLAGKFNFVRQGNAGAVDNQGTIQSATGGSVYLVGSSVSNSGVIRSAGGEVILGAGETVTLADTATPGVTVNVTGSAGNVTNLGTITADAGRIGVAAGLINNSGVISASSVVKQGGRVFLRASQSLTTTATSGISADGTTGGNVTLYSAGSAYIDGAVSATGSAGKGGFVETSGLKQLDVVKAPTVGSGGTWYIDPYDLEVVDGGNVANSGNVISSSGELSQISNGTINTLLNANTSVTLATGQGGNPNGGNITISADIIKSGGVDTTLTLNADNNIAINANITSTSSIGKLNLTARTDAGDSLTGEHSVVIGSGGNVSLGGGLFQVVNGTDGIGNGALTIASGGKLDLGMNGQLQAGSLLINGRLESTALVTVNVSGDITNNGYFNLQNGQLHASGFTTGSTGNTTLGNVTGAATSMTNSGSLTLQNMYGAFTGTQISNEAGGTLKLTGGFSESSLGGISNAGTLSIQDASGVTAGAINNNGGGTLSVTNSTVKATDFGNYQTLNLNAGATLDVTNSVTNNGTINIAGAVSLTTSGTLENYGNVSQVSGSSLVAKVINNNQDANWSGNGTITTNGGFNNYGTLAPGGNGTIGSLTINGSYRQDESGTLLIDIGNPGVSGNAGTSDTITFNSSSVAMGGTLKTRLVGTTPALNDYYSPFTFVGGTEALKGSYFRYVTGDVITAGGGKQMVKALYGDDNGGIKLVMLGAANITAINGDYGWGNRNAWSTGSIPTEIDTVIINSGVTSTHGSGTDTLDKIIINGGGTLNVGGGNLTVSNGTTLDGQANVTGGANLTLGATLSGNGTIKVGQTDYSEGDYGTVLNLHNALSGISLTVNAGDVNFDGNVRLSGLSLFSGNVNGATGSRLNVAETFVQTGGSMTLADAALSNNGTGVMSVGDITANNLVLESQGGSIDQLSETSLRVKTQLIAKAVSGIDLTGGSANKIAAFAANNSGVGDIKLTNRLNPDDTSSVILNGVTTNTGNITIDNTGALQTAALGSRANFLGDLPSNSNGTTVSTATKLAILGINSTGQVKATTGNVTLATHSPLTIGSGGVNAGGNIALTAGAASDPTSNLAVNGSLTGGNINLVAGNNLNVNANIVSSGTYSASATGSLAYASGVSITTSTGTTIPNPSVSSSGSTNSSSSVTQSQNQQAQNLQSTVNSSQSGSGSDSGDDVQQSGGGGSSQSTGSTEEGSGAAAKSKAMYCS